MIQKLADSVESWSFLFLISIRHDMKILCLIVDSFTAIVYICNFLDARNFQKCLGKKITRCILIGFLTLPLSSRNRELQLQPISAIIKTWESLAELLRARNSSTRTCQPDDPSSSLCSQTEGSLCHLSKTEVITAVVVRRESVFTRSVGRDSPQGREKKLFGARGNQISRPFCEPRQEPEIGCLDNTPTRSM